jgi:hypothetical protein
MIHIECDCGEVYHADESHVGKGIDMPPLRQVSTTFRRAPRSRGRGGAAQGELEL